ncbi:hypothetical protein SALBM311S_12363 [Streptomyces alboniger]
MLNHLHRIALATGHTVLATIPTPLGYVRPRSRHPWRAERLQVVRRGARTPRPSGSDLASGDAGRSELRWELTAYIAYLSGDPVRAFRLSLDLAHVHHRARDAEAAYANVQSAFTAWRAVRDPREGLDLGHDLIALWTELTSEEGPAVDDIEQLERAHARMGRLTDRARDSD